MSGVTGAVLSAAMKPTCAAGADGEASVMIQPWFMTSRKPSKPENSRLSRTAAVSTLGTTRRTAIDNTKGRDAAL